jgi:predicted transcriptional regulator
MPQAKRHQLDPERSAKLDKFAAKVHRPSEELLNEAIDFYLDDEFVQDVHAGMVEADAGDFATDEETRALNAKYGVE